MLKGYNRYEVSASANAQSFAAKTHRVEANVPGMGMGGMGGMGGSGGFGGTASAIKGFFDKLVMEGIIMDKDAAAQRRMARDMYRYDAVCGGAVDLMALLPWSNATLSGVADKKILEKYQTCVQSMNMMMLMPEATVDHLVNAQFIGSMQWDANESTFIGIAPQDPEQCTFQHVPFYGKDPLISLKFSDGFKQLVEAAKKDPRAAKMLSENAPNLASQLARKEIPLDPDTTVYVPRRTFASQIEPTSFLTRAMPVWIIEKALMRGTIELSYKRQRSIMHILLGGEDWEPTVEEATNYVNLFQAADSDPTSAIIATRPDVLVTEVRCLAGNSLVHTQTGLRAIDSLVEHDKHGEPFSVELNDVRVKGFDGKFVDVKEWHFHGTKPTFKITTSSGNELIATCNHKFFTTFEGELKFKKTSDMLGQYVLTPMLQAETKGTRDLSNIEYTVYQNRKGNIDITIPKRMTPELAYAMGLVVSEGYMNRKSIQVTNTNMDVLNKYVACMAASFERKPSIRVTKEKGNSTFRYIDRSYRRRTYTTKPCYSAELSSMEIVSFLEGLGVKRSIRKKKSPAYYKRIPHAILQADRECRLAFMAAYIQGDGNIARKENNSKLAVEIKFFSRSVKILRSLKTMLADMGYRSTFSRKFYNLYLPTCDASKLYNELNSYMLEDKAHYTYCDDVRARQLGIPADVFIPFLKSRFVRRQTQKKDGTPSGSFFINDDGEKVFIAGGWGNTFRHYLRANSYLMYDKFDDNGYRDELNIIKRVSKKLYATLMTLFKLRYRFDKVVSVKPHKDLPVYDLTIRTPGMPAFMVNGVVGHNSASDFWRYDEIMEATSAFKYRALGFNENFLIGDANFNTMENALSTFLERLKYLRFVMSQRIFYNKIFPYIAKQNDFKIKGDPKPIEVTGYYEDNVIYSTEDRRFPNYSLFSRGVDTLYCRSQGYVEIGSERFNPAQYHIPHLSYVKALKPEADSAYLDIMKTMEEKGIPIPLQMWASASGFNINEVMRGYDDDIKYRKAINAYLKKMPKSAMKKESDEDGAFEEASFREHMIAALAKDGPIGLGRRKFTDRDNEMRDPDTRKVLSRRGRAVRLERLHKNGAEAMTRIAARENRGVNERIQAAAQRLHTYAGLNIPVPKSVAAMEKSARMKRSHIIRAASL